MQILEENATTTTYKVPDLTISKRWDLSSTADQMLKSGKIDLQFSKLYKIIGHAQDKFERLMKIDGVTHAELYNSLNIAKNKKKVFKAGEGAGASGSFFFFSKDDRLLIKTL